MGVVNLLSERVGGISDALGCYYRDAGKFEIFSDGAVAEQTQEWLREHGGDATASGPRTADEWLVVCVAYGPWIEPVQARMALSALTALRRLGGDLRSVVHRVVDVQREFGYRFVWQNTWIEMVASHLAHDNRSFSDLCEELRHLPGLQARDALLALVAAAQGKTISCFVRDYLLCDAFPIDRRVRRLLEQVALPPSEEVVVELCRRAGCSPGVLNRMMYDYEKGCTNNRRPQCCLRDFCFIADLENWECRTGKPRLQTQMQGAPP